MTSLARIALVYDFDGTLSPQPMQEYTVLRKLGIAPDVFWEKVRQTALSEREEAMLTYMRLIIEAAERAEVHLGREDFQQMAQNIEYFPGVDTWFDRMTTFVKNNSLHPIQVDHYVISAGMVEILEGVSIFHKFRRVYASEYHYNHHGAPTFPKQLITDTTKTQFLFRINKGRESLTESINDHMPNTERPVPFSNMIYLGDGMTDVPSMAVMRSNGGHAIAVYPSTHEPPSPSTNRHGLSICKKLLEVGRVDFIAPADYREGSVLEYRVQLLLKSIISKIDYENELGRCHQENHSD